jgi:hypothetical protein
MADDAILYNVMTAVRMTYVQILRSRAPNK